MSWDNFSYRNPNEINTLSILSQIRDFPNDTPIHVASRRVPTNSDSTISTVFYEPHPASGLGHTLRPLSQEEKAANQAAMAQIKYDLELAFGFVAAGIFKMEFRHHIQSGEPITKGMFMQFMSKHGFADRLEHSE